MNHRSTQNLLTPTMSLNRVLINSLLSPTFLTLSSPLHLKTTYNLICMYNVLSNKCELLLLTVIVIYLYPTM